MVIRESPPFYDQVQEISVIDLNIGFKFLTVCTVERIHTLI